MVIPLIPILAICLPPCFSAVDIAYLPSCTNALEIVTHQDYTLGYREDWELAAWVAETLTPSMFAPNYDRANGFRADPSVSTGSAVSSDYTNSGYDRGHLAPAADFSYDETAMYDSFYMSNIAPQVPNLNRGVWASLEDWVRTVTKREQQIVVITGPIITGAVTRIGKNNVAVPNGFFKALYDLSPPQKMIGFIYANQSGESKILAEHAVPIDTIEAITSLDLFASVTNSPSLEAECDLSAWQKNPHTPFLILIR